MPFVQDQKKSVWFKKQRYHCVYEYPKETPPVDNQADATINSEPTLYSGINCTFCTYDERIFRKYFLN